MTFSELNGMTVLQLRKLARENSVVLGAGIDKAGIIEKLLSVLSGDTETASNTNTVAEEASQSEPKYQAAWHNTDTPRYNVRPAYQAPGSASRPAWQNTSPSGHQFGRGETRVQPVRSAGYTPRFGPAPSAPAPDNEQPQAQNEEISRPAVSPLPNHRISETAVKFQRPRA